VFAYDMQIKNALDAKCARSIFMLTYCNGPKVGIKFLKISHIRQNIIPCFLTFCSSDQSLLKFQIVFKYSNINHGYLLGTLFLLADENNITKYNVTGTYLIMLVKLTYMAKQLYYCKLQSNYDKKQSIYSSV